MHMSADDSQYLLGERTASTLKLRRAIFVDDEQSSALEKFKPYILPVRKAEREAEIQRFANLLQKHRSESNA